MFTKNKVKSPVEKHKEAGRHKHKLLKTEQTSRVSDDVELNAKTHSKPDAKALKNKVKDKNSALPHRKRGRPRKICTNSLSVSCS